MPAARQKSTGFSLIEILIVVVLLSIAAAVMVTNTNPAISEQLAAAARVTAAELGYARSLAVSNNSQYRVTFDGPSDQMVLQHSGSDSTLDALPPSAFKSPSDPADQQITRLAELPGIEAAVEVVSMYTAGSVTEPATEVEFGNAGETTDSQPMMIWLATGSGPARRYISLTVNPVTGLVDVGTAQAAAPSVLNEPGGDVDDLNEGGAGGNEWPDGSDDESASGTTPPL